MVLNLDVPMKVQTNPNELGSRLAIYKMASLGTLVFSNLV
jgi:hypothetical protein